MNQQQTKAIERLQAAMAECSRVKLYLYVASGSLLAYDAKAIDKFEDAGKGDMHDAMEELQEDAIEVLTYETRIDGGDF